MTYAKFAASSSTFLLKSDLIAFGSIIRDAILQDCRTQMGRSKTLGAFGLLLNHFILFYSRQGVAFLRLWGYREPCCARRL